MKLISLILLVLLGSTVQSQTFSTEAEESLKSHITSNTSAGIAGGYASSDQILWIGYEGYADIKAKKPIDSLSLFRTASIAKSMTAIAIMQLVERGKLDLDQPIIEYIDNFPIKDGSSITARHLLQHSSGIGAYKSSKESESKKEYATLRDAMTVFEDRELRFEPGTNYFYTTYGYVVLGWLIEEITGVSYDSYIKENILVPTKMYHTGVENFLDPVANLSKLYSQKNKIDKRYRPKNNKVIEKKRTNLSNRIPGGGFYSTVEDLLKFGQAILNNDLVSSETLELMWTDSKLKKEGNPYGLGWFLYGQNPKHGHVYGHSGGQTGASSQLMILPEEDIVLVIMSNTSRTWAHIFGMMVNFFDYAVDHKNQL